MSGHCPLKNHVSNVSVSCRNLPSGFLILIINFDGKYYAINGRCTHMGGEFVKGKIEGKIITCPRHGAKFDVTTGKCISGPKIGILKLKTKDEVTYEVKIENESINVNF